MEQLFALKRDLDMVTQDVKNLQLGYGALDYITQIVRKLDLELMAQNVQMKRIEAAMFDWAPKMEKRVENLENGMEVLKGQLSKITVHLKIK
jgi:hypothetical protein